MNTENLILVLDLSEESEKAKKLLNACHLSFMEVFRTSDDGSPTLISSGSAYSYQGYEEIKEYADSLPVSKKS